MFLFVRTRREIENSKKIAKKIKKIKKLHYGLISIQNWLENHETERKQKLSFRFVLTWYVIENSKKNSKKIKNIKKIQLWLLFIPKYVGEGHEREKMKIIVPIRSYPAHSWKFQKNSSKIRKSNKYTYSFISSQNRLENHETEGK